MSDASSDRWLAGDAYDAFMGRWSRRLAFTFLEWLQPGQSAHWLEIGCGTGALTRAISERADPASVVACDASAPFVEFARTQIPDARVSFVASAADSLPRRDPGFDLAVAGLVLNFVPDPAAAMSAIRERLAPGGQAAVYVWDYADGMEFLRIFWDEAAALDSGADALHEGKRFPLCQPNALASVFQSAGFQNVETHALEMATDFASFDDYWTPFLSGTGPAPAYVASLDDHAREGLRRRLEDRLRSPGDERVRLRARAWAVRGASPA
jgi:trans-aconitate methyltransferase